MTIEIFRTIDGIREHTRALQSKGKTVAVVPTMGGLHAGHLSLMRHAQKIADHVVVSIFVNPMQFNNPDDLETYPNNEANDLAKLKEIKIDTLYAPTVDDIYPEGFSTQVKVNSTANVLCDAHRPGHFDGVSTVVTKLFMQIGANYACFGEKDFQQLLVIKRLVKDLNIPIQIEAVPTVREEDGLAMSSRNSKLTKAQRKIAPKLNQEMQNVRAEILAGAEISKSCSNAIERLQQDNAFKIEYLEVRSADDLSLVEDSIDKVRIFAAAWLGDVRLIDNVAV